MMCIIQVQKLLWSLNLNVNGRQSKFENNISQMQTAHIGAIGIDLGSQRSVIAVAKKGGVEVLANEGSHRETQNIIGFGDRERFIGEQGALQSKSNFKNTVNFFTRFLGLQGKPPFYRDETRWLTVSHEQNSNGKQLFNVQYYGQKQQYTPEQLTASLLNKLKDILHYNNINVSGSNVVISVPTYYTEQERKALLDACKIAELPLERVFNETTSIATSYGLFRKNDLEVENPRYVAFIDFGHSKTSAFVGSFTKEKAQIVAQVNDRNFGARDIDWSIYEQYCEIFEGQSGGLSPKESKKAQLRLLEAIEKQRKVLSANSEAAVNVEYLMEDIDFNHNLKREEYEKLIENVLQRFSQILEFLAQQIQNLKIKLHSVEIVGGATRMPIVQQIIQSVLKVESVSKTLNASECIARGCAMMAAMRSPSFRVTEYIIEDANFYPIRVGWLFNSTLDTLLKQQQQGMEIESSSLTNIFPEKQRPILFDNNCGIPSLKSFNLTRTEPIEVTLFYDPPPPGYQPIIQQLRIPAVKPTHPEFFTKIRIRLNQNGLTNIEDVCLIEEFLEEVKVPKEKPQEQQQQQATPQTTDKPAGESSMQVEPPANAATEEFELKKKKKQQSTLINCDASNYYSASPKEISANFEVEVTMMNQDRLTHETYNRKNELEAYIYQMKDQLGTKLKDFVLKADADKLAKELDVQYDWLYEDGRHAQKSEYVKRLETLKVLGDPINKRYNDYILTPDLVSDFHKVIKQVEQFSQTTDPKFEHILPQERDQVVTECQNAKNWTQQILQKNDACEKTKAIEYPPQEVQKFQQEFVKVFSPLYAKKTEAIMYKPKPKEEPVKAAEPQQQQQQQPQQPATDSKMETE